MKRERVLLLDDDEDVREALGELITLLTGHSTFALASVRELTEQRERALGCDLAILDVNLGAGQPSGLVAHAWLSAERFRGRVVFLTGHAARHPLVVRAATGGARVLAKPIGIDELRGILPRRAAA